MELIIRPDAIGAQATAASVALIFTDTRSQDSVTVHIPANGDAIEQLVANMLTARDQARTSIAVVGPEALDELRRRREGGPIA